MKYFLGRREKLGGFLPQRRTDPPKLSVPELDVFSTQLEATGEREVSTTMAFVRMLNTLLKDKKLGKAIVPIVPDEARTFGMEGMFRQLGIYSSVGQLYTPQDADQLMFYKEDKTGQILEEGITEAGAMSSWIASATSWANHGVVTIPFYIYYSMFGFQRIGDLAWAAGDSRARGFLLGGTAGRTTLNGEGLQHQDGHSHILAATIPNCVSYDPTFGYEIAVIVQDGLRRMFVEQEDVYYYLTLYNDNYEMPPMPVGDGVESGVIDGMYPWSDAPEGPAHQATLLFSGTAYGAVARAQQELAERWDVAADTWSVTSYKKLREDAMATQRWNRLHPGETPRQALVTRNLAERAGPVVAVTDFMKAVPDQVSRWVGRPWASLGTDGFGRSDTREALRSFFEVDAPHIVVATLAELAAEGSIPADTVAEAIKAYDIDPDIAEPWTR
jgi:pyruvate dehydrogenase E1 component